MNSHLPNQKNEQEYPDSGFSFTELLISCAIMIILAAVAVPVFSNVLDRVKVNADTSTASAIQTAYDTALLMDEDSIRDITSFDDLVKKLNEKGYLSESEYNPQSDNSSFGFEAGKVTFNKVP